MSEAGHLVWVARANEPGTDDPAGCGLNDWAKQRNLDTTGSAPVRRFGQGLREHGISDSPRLHQPMLPL